jgi:hypothetical protein
MAALFCSCCTAIQINREFETSNIKSNLLLENPNPSLGQISVPMQRSYSMNVKDSKTSLTQT